MITSKRLFCLLVITGLHLHVHSQNTVICRVSPAQENVVNIKWYSPKLIYPEGVNIYRRTENTSDWIKLNSTPIKKGNYIINAAVYQKDKELQAYIQMLDNEIQLTGFSLLAVLLKSFTSEPYACYMGIQFDDSTVIQGKKYEYKAQEITADTEIPLATSSPIEIKTYQPIEPIKNVEAKIKRIKCMIRWEPEPLRYYGVNIYRHSSENKTDIKLNKEPLVPSKTKNKDDMDNYSEVFYVDEKLKHNTTYFYTLVAIDFFGEESKRSEPIAVFVKDTEAPAAPENLRKSVDGKTVKLVWTKNNKEKDLAGYNIYRTIRSDSDYIKINNSIIHPTDSSYIDKVLKFKPYFYMASAVDKDGNEAHSVPAFVDVFDNEAPSAPKRLKVFADTGRLTLQWDANTETDILGYLVYRTINKNESSNYVLLTPLPIKGNSFVDDLPDNAKNNFLYKIVAVDSTYNKSPYSAFAANKMPDTSPPASPFIKQIKQNEKNEAVVEWLPNSEPDLMAYNIYRKTLNDSNATFKKQNATILNRGAFMYIDGYTAGNRPYAYYLTAIDSSGNTSAPSNNFRFHTKTIHKTATAAITDLKANYNERKKTVELSWNTTGKNLKFTLYKKENRENNLGPCSGMLTNNSYADKNVKEGQTYFYQVRGYNDMGDVVYSEMIKMKITR